MLQEQIKFLRKIQNNEQSGSFLALNKPIVPILDLSVIHGNNENLEPVDEFYKPTKAKCHKEHYEKIPSRANMSVKSQVKSFLKSDSKSSFLGKETTTNKGRNLALEAKKMSMSKIWNKTSKILSTKSKAQDRYKSPNNDAQKFIKKHGLGPTVKQNNFNYKPMSRTKMTSHGSSFIAQSSTKSTTGKFIKKCEIDKKRKSCNGNASRLHISSSSKNRPICPESVYAAYRSSTNMSHYVSTSNNKSSFVRSPTDFKKSHNMFDLNKSSKTPEYIHSNYKVSFFK